MPAYHALYEVACELEDWGISANIARICDYNTLKQEALAEICKWEACVTHGLCVIVITDTLVITELRST